VLIRYHWHITHSDLSPSKRVYVFLLPPQKKRCSVFSLWHTLVCFSLHTRPDSSGFEHVFVGETRGGRTVIGFHNWIQLYLQEKLGHIDYKGYSGNASSPRVRDVHHLLQCLSLGYFHSFIGVFIWFFITVFSFLFNFLIYLCCILYLSIYTYYINSNNDNNLYFIIYFCAYFNYKQVWIN